MFAPIDTPESTPSPSEPEPAAPAKRKRGGQRGNRNARKHGFYMRKLDESQILEIQKHDFNDLYEEIALMRLFLRRFADVILAAEGADPLLTADNLRAVSLALGGLTRLMKTQILLQQNPISENIIDSRKAFARACAESQAEARLRKNELQFHFDDPEPHFDDPEQSA